MQTKIAMKQLTVWQHLSYKQIDRRTDKQTGKQTNRLRLSTILVYRQVDIQTSRPTGRQAEDKPENRQN